MLPVLQPSIQQGMQRIRHILCVASGKGGVGKSCVAVNLALALQQQGFRVGLLDADLYGPSVRKMLPEEKMPEQQGDLFFPAQAKGIFLLSMAYFRKRENPIAIRSPIANGLVRQFLHNTVWGDLDYLLIDSPPGTGDIVLSLTQQASLTGVVLVTTPQEIALDDVRKTMRFFQHVNIPLIGVVENMSYWEDKERHFPFGKGGGRRLAEEGGMPLLGEIPLVAHLCQAGDRGESIFLPDSKGEISPIARLFTEIAERIRGRIGEIAHTKKEEAYPLIQKDPSILLFSHRGERYPLPASLVQKHCPCAACKEQEKILDPNVTMLRLSPVGRYAVRIQFSSGCSHGIYPFSLFQKLTAEVPCHKD